MKKLAKVQTLICCCCGASTKGRQWFNRDQGYGLCENCIRDNQAQGKHDSFGVEGIHYNIEAAAEIEKYGCTEQQVDDEAVNSLHVVMDDDLCGHIKEILEGTELLLLFFNDGSQTIAPAIQQLHKAQHLLEMKSYDDEQRAGE